MRNTAPELATILTGSRSPSVRACDNFSAVVCRAKGSSNLFFLSSFFCVVGLFKCSGARALIDASKAPPGLGKGCPPLPCVGESLRAGRTANHTGHISMQPDNDAGFPKFTIVNQNLQSAAWFFHPCWPAGFRQNSPKVGTVK